MLRADASPDVGGGHAMRCLAIAEALTAEGAEVAFAVGPRAAEIVPAVRRFPVIAPEPAGGADAVLLDGYHLTAEHARAWAEAGAAVAVLDDAPGRPRPCALWIDPTPGRTAEAYAGTVGEARLLLGPDYAPVAAAYGRLRSATLQRRARGGPVQVVLVSTGLTDAAGLAPAAAAAALAACANASVDVAVGSSAVTLPALRELAADQRRLTLHVDAPAMAALTAGADLAVGAAGSSSWERCALGLPTVALVAAENQRDNAAALARSGAAIVVDDLEAVQPALERLAASADQRRAMADAAANLCDGRGAERIARALLELVTPR